MSAVSKNQTPSIKSVTIIRQDPLPNAGPGVQALARQNRFLQSVAVLVTDVSTPDKFKADVSESQTHDFGMAVTANPVENGSFITDHVRRLQNVLSFSGLITDTPLTLIPVPIQANRAHREWTKLLAIFNEREPVFVATSLRVYPSMIIEQLTVHRTPDSGGSIPISMTLREIQIASLATNIPLTDQGAAGAGALPLDSGGTLAAVPI